MNGTLRNLCRRVVRELLHRRAECAQRGGVHACVVARLVAVVDFLQFQPAAQSQRRRRHTY